MSKARVVRSDDPMPHICKEGIFLKPLPLDIIPEREQFPAKGELPHWTKGLTPWQRLYSRHTLCSVRHARLFLRPMVPQDSLDLVLASTYHHDKDVLPDKVDVLLQPETVGLDTWRLLRNTKIIPAVKAVRRGHPIRYGGQSSDDEDDADADADAEGKSKARRVTKKRCPGDGMPKRSIFSVKLGIAADHSPATNAGFSRKVDGTYYAV